MSERKGLLTPEQEKFLGELIDEKVKFKNPILEAIDGSVFKVLITVIDDNLGDKLPDEEWQNPLAEIANAAMAEDWDLVQSLGAKLLDSKINIPGVDDISEAMIFDSGIKLIVSIILQFASKKEDPVA